MALNQRIDVFEIPFTTESIAVGTYRNRAGVDGSYTTHVIDGEISVVGGMPAKVQHYSPNEDEAQRVHATLCVFAQALANERGNKERERHERA